MKIVSIRSSKNKKPSEGFIEGTGYPCIDDILEEYRGQIPFQETLMQMFASVCEITFGSADSVRRVVAKKMDITNAKHYAEIIKVKDQWESACLKRGIDNDTRDVWWNKILANAEYCFNKSHSDSYSVLTYETLWYRYNYPLEFIVVRMSIKPDEQTFWLQKLAELGYEVLPPHVNKSHETEYTIVDGKVLMPITSLKGFGLSAAQEIVRCRPYIDVAGFENSVSKTVVNKTKKYALWMMNCFEGLSGDFSDLDTDRVIEVAGVWLQVTHHKSKKEHIVEEFKSRYDVYHAFLNNAIIYSADLVSRLSKLKKEGYRIGVITKIESGVTQTGKPKTVYYFGNKYPDLNIGNWAASDVELRIGRELKKGDFIAYLLSPKFRQFLDKDNIVLLNHLV